MRRVVVVGGGSAGWITACVVAAAHRSDSEVSVVVVESPDVPTIGVGEGTWPSMRGTLQRIGIAETEFVRGCDASFKQGTRFTGWGRGLDVGGAGAQPDDYPHPFSWPLDYASVNPASHWLAASGGSDGAPFAQVVTPQAEVIARGLAPKQATTPQYAFAVNYGYHLDAGKFALLLRRHAVEQLGVRHMPANVVGIVAKDDGDIASLALDTGENVGGDLFVDCTGLAALLIGKHYGQGVLSAAEVLFNDRAIVAQVSYADPRNDPIASVTTATAQAAGWIWDIGLPTRRGLGYVHSSAHTAEETAQHTLRTHIAKAAPHAAPGDLAMRTIAFAPGRRKAFWVRNCVAVGLSAGFIEPLEASALALVEQAAGTIAEQLPRDRGIMDIVAKRFNAKMDYHWERIIEFLKLHYAVSRRRDNEYWRDHANMRTWPDGLREKLALWQQQPPWHDDAPLLGELFPSASYQYVLYGMGFRPRYLPTGAQRAKADDLWRRTRAQAQRLVPQLPTTRELVAALVAHG